MRAALWHFATLSFRVRSTSFKENTDRVYASGLLAAASRAPGVSMTNGRVSNSSSSLDGTSTNMPGKRYLHCRHNRLRDQ